ARRTARAYTGRDKIAKAEGAYQGAHDYALQSTDMDARTARRMTGYRPIPYGRGIPKPISDTVVVFPYNDIDATAAILDDNDDEVGALIIEPVLCGPGVVAPKGNYLKRLRQLTRKKGIVLIFDEVLTGFRLAYGGAQEYYDVRPEMTPFGKIAGGAYQLAGYGQCEHPSMVELVHPLPRNQRPVRHPEYGRARVPLHGTHGRGHRMGSRGRGQRIRRNCKGGGAAPREGARRPAPCGRRAGGAVRRNAPPAERVRRPGAGTTSGSRPVSSAAASPRHTRRPR